MFSHKSQTFQYVFPESIFIEDSLIRRSGDDAGIRIKHIYKFIRNGGGLCELGFFINGGDATINPHFDLCSKEITLVGSWVYTLRDYATTFDFLKRAIAIGLPIKELITHRFPLEEMNEALETNLAQKGLKIAYVRKDLI